MYTKTQRDVPLPFDQAAAERRRRQLAHQSQWNISLPPDHWPQYREQLVQMKQGYPGLTISYRPRISTPKAQRAIGLTTVEVDREVQKVNRHQNQAVQRRRANRSANRVAKSEGKS